MDQNSKINEIIEAKKKESGKEKVESRFVKEILVIELNTTYYGVQLEYLREVMELQDRQSIVSLPYTPSYILGIVNIRGDIIPVISLLEILGTKEKDEEMKKIAILDHHFRIAFPFKDIIDLETVDVNSMKELKDASKKPEEQFLSHELDYQGNTVSIINIYKLYSSHYLK